MYSAVQVPPIKSEAVVQEVVGKVGTGPPKEIHVPLVVTAEILSSPSPPPPPISRPQTATSKIFAPRTEEMSKGFLTFSDDEPGLTSKWKILLYTESFRC